MRELFNGNFTENTQNVTTREIVDIYVYDEEGERVAVLDSLRNTQFKEGKNCMFLEVEDALLNIPFFKFAQNYEESNEVAYPEPKFDELFTEKIKQNSPYITIPVSIHGDHKEGKTKKMSLVAFTSYRNTGGLDKQVFYKIPNVQFVGFRGLNHNSSAMLPQTIHYIFQIDYTAQGTFYDFIIEK